MRAGKEFMAPDEPAPATRTHASIQHETPRDAKHLCLQFYAYIIVPRAKHTQRRFQAKRKMATMQGCKGEIISTKMSAIADLDYLTVFSFSFSLLKDNCKFTFTLNRTKLCKKIAKTRGKPH